ncbi:MAG: hypothetical protein QNK05_01845 [Myxococcota bacterium]|nr:hypothetical protein [Myxococcota bacterium]
MNEEPEAPEDLEALLDHLVASTRLERSEAARVVAEVLEFFGEGLEDFVVRRHAELRARQLANAEIFARIAGELGLRRFKTPPLSERQIRRLIYG